MQGQRERVLIVPEKMNPYLSRQLALAVQQRKRPHGAWRWLSQEEWEDRLQDACVSILESFRRRTKPYVIPAGTGLSIVARRIAETALRNRLIDLQRKASRRKAEISLSSLPVLPSDAKTSRDISLRLQVQEYLETVRPTDRKLLLIYMDTGCESLKTTAEILQLRPGQVRHQWRRIRAQFRRRDRSTGP